tara:strand:- start:156 stop:332 length:177 start_codon:yes stop_codon:yes gene_type:complete
MVSRNLKEIREMQYQWDRAFQVDASSFAARFWDGPTPFEEGNRATAAWYTMKRSADFA